MEELLVDAKLELDAINSEEHMDLVKGATVNLEAAIANPESRDSYVEEAEKLVTKLSSNLEREGPWFTYAERAKGILRSC